MYTFRSGMIFGPKAEHPWLLMVVDALNMLGGMHLSYHWSIHTSYSMAKIARVFLHAFAIKHRILKLITVVREIDTPRMHLCPSSVS